MPILPISAFGCSGDMARSKLVENDGAISFKALFSTPEFSFNVILKCFYGDPAIHHPNIFAGSSCISLNYVIIAISLFKTLMYLSTSFMSLIIFAFLFFLFLFLMIFRWFKKVEMICWNFKEHLSILYEDSRKLNHVAFWDHSFSDTIRLFKTTIEVLRPLSNGLK